jgi:hypothetical protein
MILNFVLRKVFFKVHRRTRLTLGLVALFLAITGLAMVFRPQIQRIAFCGRSRYPRARPLSCAKFDSIRTISLCRSEQDA